MPAIDSRLQWRWRCRRIGVRPRGAQVRRTGGVKLTPLSSRNTSHAPRRRAFLPDPGPVLLDPAGDGGLVALQGAALGPLHGPAHRLEEAPDMRGWWRTPVRRQITVWIRLQVHRSVSNPCASAPCSSARSILRRWRAVSLGLRPGPVERRAARPPCCHAWYQRWVFWREVPSRWATSAWLVPCSNMLAARSRRRSIPLKSRSSLVGG